MSVPPRLGRRLAVATALAVLTMGTAPAVTAASANSDEAGLRPLAEAADANLGAAVDVDVLDDVAYRRLIADNVTMVSTTDELSFAVVQPERGQFDFVRAERIVDFAVENGLTVRGHDLVDVDSLPPWVTDGNWTADELGQVLTEHVSTVVDHFEARNPGAITQWDVVSNAVLPDGSPRPSILQIVIGDGYIGAAFNAAHTADPDAALFYDDFYDDFSIVQDAAPSGASASGGANALRTTCDLVAKCVGVEAMVDGLLGAQVPIDGIGFQAHLLSPDPVDFSQFTSWVERLDLAWAITEFDVPLPATEVADAVMLEYQAGEYAAALDACLSSSGCDTFITWGITDRIASSTSNETGGAFGGPFWFDGDDQPKQAVAALATVLEGHVAVVPTTTTITIATTAPTPEPEAPITQLPAAGDTAATDGLTESGDSSSVVPVVMVVGALVAFGLIVVVRRRRH